jgi:hypothetical protein
VNITKEPLQPTHRPALDVEGHGLNRLAFQWAQLAYHIIEEMCARFTPGKTIVESGLELPQFLQKPFYIAGYYVKRGNGVGGTFRATGW